MYKFYKDIIVSPRSCITNTLQLTGLIKTTVALLFIGMMQISTAATAQTVTLTEKNARLSTVLEKMRKQTGYDFLYTTSTLKGAAPVTITVKNVPLERALTTIFDNQPLQFSIRDKSVVISKKAALTYTVIHPTLHGVVYDESNKPLPGASVRIDGLDQTAVTNNMGIFFLKDPPSNGNLIVSYIGFQTDTIAITGRGEINLHLTMANLNMKEVVIVNTGYQKLNKERATGSFGKPDMKIFNERAGTTDVVSRMEGLVAGMSVTPGSKGRGANRFGLGGNQVSIIRGKSTALLATDPVYVVNGVLVENLSMLNTDDIADISILKDASAAAIWGARAANGVIVITTKTGRAEEKIKFNYTGYITTQGKPDFSYGRYMNSSQYIKAARETFDPVVFPYNSLSQSVVAPHETILYNQSRGLVTAAQANSSLDSLAGIDNQQQIKDLWYRNAFTTNQTLSASGGTQFYNFYSSLSYLKNYGSQVGSSDNTYRITLNQIINPTKSIRLSINTILSNNITRNVRPVTVGPDFLPYQLFQDAAGNNLNLNYIKGLSPATVADYQSRSRINLDYSPLDDMYMGDTKSNMLTLNTSADLNVKIIKGLSFNGTYGYQKSPGTSLQYDDAGIYDMRRELLNFTVARVPGATPVYYLPGTGGKYATINYNSYNWTVRNQLMYHTQLRGGKDELNLQAGQEVQEQYRNSETTTVRGYNRDLTTYSLLDYNTLAQGVFGAVGSFRSVFNERPFVELYERQRYRSYFGLMNYSFEGKYILDASIRRDFSNLFATNSSSQKKPAYSFGGKWLITREDFMKSHTWIDNLGLRVTYGITGNSPYLKAGALQDILATEINNTYGNSLYITSPQNNKLSWESTHSFNTGIDFGLLAGRLNGSIDYYSKNTTDLLGKLPTNPLTGSDNISGNVGNITNKGIEVTLRSMNIQSAAFSWTSNFVFSYNQNKLVTYSALDASQNTASFRLNAAQVVGYTSSPLFAYHYMGLDNMGDPQIRLADGSITKEVDAATADDLVYMGTTQPKFNGGLSNTFRYKNISLTANMIYNLGGVMRRDVNTFYYGRAGQNASGFAGNLNEDFDLRWKKPGDEAFTDIPSYVANAGISTNRRNTQYYTFADINVVSSSYIKLRDITLSYDFTARLLRAIHLDAARIYMQTGNFMLWKANKYDIDPEYQTFSVGTRSIPAFSHPLTLGVNVTF
ncbi:SusC/RagA family TonB-linked outer membrane protein [Pedobacter sp. MR2016-24]|uniref:SusC/RagA family TonB-linked outer membrane protein n=1 Tax=Pedobacter sp. MR2016-24 TaxID=2994466 RepID=UPI002246FB49|nr:SusC/RagA family TonB-linked outer membrane protein [Pedobacter sp. MR2016-24]MCX2483818.1 SusC/RagA family TonB-linked outer membrane protein [Pedobacter sp. MR2016-24]